jgi:hypothetical protein
LFATLLEQIKGAFGRQFLLASFLPTLVFVGLSLSVAFELDRGLGHALEQWAGLGTDLQVVSLVGLTLLCAGIGYVLSNLQFAITRLFEGYWPRPLLPLRNWRTRYHAARWQELDRRAAAAIGDTEKNEIFAQQLTYYPPPTHLDKMMPTRLGNILRASELHAYDRYGIDSAPIWTRLWPLLEPEQKAPLEEYKLTRDFMLLMAVLSASFAIVWCPILAAGTRRWDLFLACAAGLPLAAIFYRTAVQAAIAYGEQVRVIFDLHRGVLLKALGRTTPATLDEERKEWLRIGRFLYRNVPLPAQAAPASAPPSAWDELAAALTDLLRRP